MTSRVHAVVMRQSSKFDTDETKRFFIVNVFARFVCVAFLSNYFDLLLYLVYITICGVIIQSFIV